MTARRRARPRRAGPNGTPNIQGHTAVLDHTARLVRAQLRRKRVDLAPLPELARTVGVTESTLCTAVARYRDLGLCETGGLRFVWWLPTAPHAGGFEPVIVDRQLVLRLPADAPDRRPLHISGRHLGAGSSDDLDAPELDKVGMGELGYTIARLSLMANRWLSNTDLATPNAHPTRRLFQLIASTWHACPEPAWSIGRLHIHQAEHPEPVGSRFSNGGRQTTALELVLWADDDDRLHVVNVYPAGTHRNVFGAESSG
jgi:hypothetical protein